jgi:hypothetical protein
VRLDAKGVNEVAVFLKNDYLELVGFYKTDFLVFEGIGPGDLSF